MKLSIRFYLDKSKLNKQSKSAVKCRLTINKKRKEFSTGLFINPDNWNSKQQYVEPPEPDADILNSQLSLIKTKINKAFLMLQVKEEDFNVDDIYRAYKGEKSQKQYNVIEFYERYLKRLKMLIGIDIKQVTYDKFEYIKNDVKSFIKWKFKTNDIPLKKLKSNFLNELEYYYKTEKGLKQITINKKIQRFRKIIKVAVADDFLEKDPFLLYKAKHVRKEIEYLTPEELEKFERHEFTQPRLQYVQDLFVFSCYSGLPYREVMNLKKKHIINGFDENLWIQMKRQKTKQDFTIPLLDKALERIKKYQNDLTEYVFPRISNQKYNSYLKEIAAIIGIEKRLTTHIARSTFATTVMLFNGVSMEVTSKALGHSSIQITQDFYGEIVEKRISLEMQKLRGSS